MGTSIVTREPRDSKAQPYLLKYGQLLDVGAVRLPA